MCWVWQVRESDGQPFLWECQEFEEWSAEVGVFPVLRYQAAALHDFFFPPVAQTVYNIRCFCHCYKFSMVCEMADFLNFLEFPNLIYTSITGDVYKPLLWFKKIYIYDWEMNRTGGFSIAFPLKLSFKHILKLLCKHITFRRSCGCYHVTSRWSWFLTKVNPAPGL